MMTKKTISILSYVTIIGWTIAFVEYEKGGKSLLTKFHLEQTMGLHILAITSNLLLSIPVLIDPMFSILLIITNTGLVILWVAGISNACHGVRLPLPVIGFYFKNRFRFIR